MWQCDGVPQNFEAILNLWKLFEKNNYNKYTTLTNQLKLTTNTHTHTQRHRHSGVLTHSFTTTHTTIYSHTNLDHFMLEYVCWADIRVSRLKRFYLILN